eukprot:GHRR01023474.1.p1 GENE.GHRR01023474.1~~GHRR01023474.1.p1  ORF type:complete len:133 (-),score=12.59 GHRR01023474.1:937-1335(-)
MHIVHSEFDAIKESNGHQIASIACSVCVALARWYTDSGIAPNLAKPLMHSTCHMRNLTNSRLKQKQNEAGNTLQRQHIRYHTPTGAQLSLCRSPASHCSWHVPLPKPQRHAAALCIAAGWLPITHRTLLSGR